MSKVLRFRDWLAGERSAVDATAVTLADNLTALFQIGGMVFLPAMPASLVFYALWLSLGHSQATIILAAIAAVGLEAVGVVACKTAMRLYRGYQRKYVQKGELVTGVAASLFYAGLVTAALLLTDELPGMAGTLGWLSPWLALILYMVTGFNVDLQIREDERADLMAYQRQQERERDRAKLDLELGTLRLEAELAAKRQEMTLKQQMEEFEANLRVKTEAKMARLERKLAQTGPRRSSEALLAEAERVYDEYNGQISGVEMAEVLGTTERTGQNYVNRVKARRNGRGEQ